LAEAAKQQRNNRTKTETETEAKPDRRSSSRRRKRETEEKRQGDYGDDFEMELLEWNMESKRQKKAHAPLGPAGHVSGRCDLGLYLH
jgi:hypothetical protein